MIANALRVEGLRLYYEEGGAGQPALALHGFGSCAQSWRPIRAHLPGLRIIAPDLKGAGWSDKPHGGDYGVPEQARLIVELIDQLGLHRPILVGHSFGGAVALEAAARLQENDRTRPPALVLINSIAFEQYTPFYMVLLRTPRVGEAFCGLLRPVFMRRGHGPVPVMPDLPLSAETLPPAPHCLLLPGGAEAFLRTARQMTDYPVGERRCACLTMPTLVLRGALDPVVPAHVGTTILARTPDARMVCLPRCGHLPHEHSPRATAEAIQAFLSDAGVVPAEASG